MKTPEAPFTDPWHAQLFALTVALSDGGRFGWADWTRAFGATLARHRLIYAALGPMMRQEIHALSIDALAPDETD